MVHLRVRPVDWWHCQGTPPDPGQGCPLDPVLRETTLMAVEVTTGRRIVRDLRDWIGWLEEQQQLARVTAPVHWHEEMGTIARRAYDVYGDASPAMLFENIADYAPPGPWRVFLGQFRSYARVAMMLGLDPWTCQRRDIIARFRDCLRGPIPREEVSWGPCKEEIQTGDAIDVLKFPVPLWHRRDGGRYIGTM